MNNELILLIALLLGAISACLLLIYLHLTTRIHHLIQDRFRHLLNVDGSPVLNDGPAATLLRWSNRLGLQRIYAASSTTLRTMIDQAGIYRPEVRAMVHGGYVVSPWVFAILATAYSLLTGQSAEQCLMAFIWGAAFGYFAPRHLLRYMADMRRRKLSEEALMMIRLMQILFEAGLSIEQTLRTLRSQGGILLPQMQSELHRIINRIEAGMDRANALDQWAGEVGVNEVSDLAEMLSQLSRQGGNIQKSLSELVTIMEERNRTRLTEKAGKLSGKMTVVMVLFLFPALMIFIAGPGVLSITAALGGIR